MCGMSYYIIGFRHEGYRYHWDEKRQAFYSPVTQRETKKMLYPCDQLEWCSQWKYDEEEEMDYGIL